MNTRATRREATRYKKGSIHKNIDLCSGGSTANLDDEDEYDREKEYFVNNFQNQLNLFLNDEGEDENFEVGFKDLRE